MRSAPRLRRSSNGGCLSRDSAQSRLDSAKRPSKTYDVTLGVSEVGLLVPPQKLRSATE